MKILVSGGGSIGTRHAKNLLTLGYSDITIAEPSERRRTELEKELEIHTASDFLLALSSEKPDIVLICSPSGLHIPQALAAAKAGVHLFIEKPLSHTTDGIDALKKEVKKQKLTCMVGCNMRFHPGPKTVKRLLEEKRIGKVADAIVYTGSYLPNWRPEQDYKKSYSADPVQGGAALDCIHEIDLALWYFGPGKIQKIKSVPAKKIDLTVEGTVDLDIQHKNGVFDHVHLSFVEPEYRRYCTMKGDKGVIAWDIHKKNVLVMDTQGDILETIPEPEDFTFNQIYMDELAYFIDCINNRRTPMGNLEDASEALKIALAVKHS